MKKIILKTKKVIISIVLAIISFPNKIFAAINPSALSTRQFLKNLRAAIEIRQKKATEN